MLREQRESGINVEDLLPAELKSIVMQDAPGTDSYRELYLIGGEHGPYVRPFSDAYLLTADGARILATNDRLDGNGGFCTYGFWVLQSDGPWLLDFGPVLKKLDVTGPENGVVQIPCLAADVDFDKLTVTAGLQEENASSRAGGWLGDAIVHFRIERHVAVPVSSSFRQNELN